MEQKEIANFQVIGRCSKMQTLSLGQEINLMDGIPYNIDFFQDFSKPRLDGWRITTIPAPTLIEAIDIPISKAAILPAGNIPQETDESSSYNRRQMFWDEIEEHEKEDRRRAKKWRKKHPKPKNQKEADEKFLRVVAEITGDDCYE